MANTNTTSSNQREQRNNSLASKSKPLADPNIQRWILQTEGIGMELMDNEAIYQPAPPPSFEASEPRVTPMPEFMGSLQLNLSPEPIKETPKANPDVSSLIIGAPIVIENVAAAIDPVIKNANEILSVGAEATGDLLKNIAGIGEYNPNFKSKSEEKSPEKQQEVAEIQALHQRQSFTEGISNDQLKVALMEEHKEEERILDDVQQEIASSPSLIAQIDEIRRKPNKKASDYHFLRSMAKWVTKASKVAASISSPKGKAAPGEQQITDSNKQGERTAGGTVLTTAG